MLLTRSLLQTSRLPQQLYPLVIAGSELEALFDHLREWCRVDRVYYDCGNWCAEVTRTN